MLLIWVIQTLQFSQLSLNYIKQKQRFIFLKTSQIIKLIQVLQIIQKLKYFNLNNQRFKALEKYMGQLQNVQRGLLFTFFIYSLIYFVAFVIKFYNNWIDKEIGLEEEDGAKYAEKKPETKAQDSNNELEASKKNTTQQKKKTSRVSSSLPNEATLNQIVLHIIKPVVYQEDQTLITRFLTKLRRQVMYHLPFFFPIALNVVTGTSYAFIFVLFFFMQFSFGLFNDLKIHLACGVENKIIKCIVQNLGYVLSFFAWVNLWGAATSTMPFFIRKE